MRKNSSNRELKNASNRELEWKRSSSSSLSGFTIRHCMEPDGPGRGCAASNAGALRCGNQSWTKHVKWCGSPRLLAGFLSDEAYAAAEKTMGLESLVALVALTGSFSMTCMTAATFGVEPPAENPIPLAE